MFGLILGLVSGILLMFAGSRIYMKNRIFGILLFFLAFACYIAGAGFFVVVELNVLRSVSLKVLIGLGFIISAIATYFIADDYRNCERKKNIVIFYSAEGVEMYEKVK